MRREHSVPIAGELDSRSFSMLLTTPGISIARLYSCLTDGTWQGDFTASQYRRYKLTPTQKKLLTRRLAERVAGAGGTCEIPGATITSDGSELRVTLSAAGRSEC